jgi:hypothetical protein
MTAEPLRVSGAAGKAVRATRPRLLRAALVGALVSVGLLMSAASAFGAIDLGPGHDQPSIAYDATTGYTYVAWADEVSLDTIDLCVVPSGGTVCNGGSGPYRLSDALASTGASPIYFGSKVLTMPDGTVVLVANVEGASEKAESAGYENEAGEIAWSSPPNGEAFAAAGQGIANGGKLLAEASGEMPDQGAAALGATHIFTYGNVFPFGSGATDFTLTGPAPKETPVPDASGEFGSSLFSDGSQLAVEEESGKPGEYLAVTVGSDADTPKECPDGSEEGTGYGVATGTPEQLQKQSAWSPSYFKVLACRAEAAVLTGGEPDGAAIGVVQSEGTGLNGFGEDGIYFRAFDASTNTFAGAVPISQEAPFTLDGAGALSASDDSGGGLYASWADGRGVEFSYSNSGGAGWLVPVTAVREAADPIIAGIGGGSAEVAYFANIGDGTQEYLQPFNYTQLYEAEHLPPPPPPPPPTPTATTTAQSGGGISGASLTVPQGTAVTDQAHISGPAAANADGTVSYTLYKNNKCTEAEAAGSAATVVNGVAGPSAPVKPGAGTYYWEASYSGDATHTGSASACGSEVLVVALNASTLGLPSSKMCLSKRHFVVHPRGPKGVKLVSIEVQINGKFIKKTKLSKHATTVSLVGLPKGTFKVALISTSSKGKIYEEVRTYHTCVPGKHKKKKK